MNAARVLLDAQPVAGFLETVAEVVVVPVSERFVEQTDPVQRRGAIDGVAGAHVIGVAVWKGEIPLLEVDAHRAHAHGGRRIADVPTLRRGHRWFGERRRQRSRPAWPDDDVLIDRSESV